MEFSLGKRVFSLGLGAIVSFIIANGLFFRSFHFSTTMSGGELTVISLALALSILGVYSLFSGRHAVNLATLSVLLSILACGFLPLIGAVLQGTNIQVAMAFASEFLILMCFILFFYWIIAFNLIKPRTLILLFLAVSLYAAFVMLDTLLLYDRIRRLSIGGAYNFQGNSFAIATAVSFFLGLSSLLQGRGSSVFYFLSMVVLAISCFLTGSKQALFVLTISILLILNYYADARTIQRVVLAVLLIGLIFGFFVLFISPQSVSFESLSRRFSMEEIGGSLSGRTTIWFGSLRVVDGPLSFLFGSPEYYTATASTDDVDTVHPHNLFVSLLLFSGMLSLFVFLWAVYVTYKFVKKATAAAGASIADGRSDISEVAGYVYILAIMLMGTLIYSLLSGQITRLFNLFIIWGALLGTTRELILYTYVVPGPSMKHGSSS